MSQAERNPSATQQLQKGSVAKSDSRREGVGGPHPSAKHMAIFVIGSASCLVTPCIALLLIAFVAIAFAQEREQENNVSGLAAGGLPTFGNRSITTVIRLRDGETNMLAGLIRDDERKVLSGVPGLVDIPVIGRLFAYNHMQTQETDIILTLTPHIVRVLDLSAEDVRAFKVGRDGGATAGLDVPTPIAPRPPAGAERPSRRPSGRCLPARLG